MRLVDTRLIRVIQWITDHNLQIYLSTFEFYLHSKTHLMRLLCEPVKLDLFYCYAKFVNSQISCRSFKTFGATKSKAIKICTT